MYTYFTKSQYEYTYIRIILYTLYNSYNNVIYAQRDLNIKMKGKRLKM